MFRRSNVSKKETTALISLSFQRLINEDYKYDDDDIYFLALQTISFRSIKSMHNDYNH